MRPIQRQSIVNPDHLLLLPLLQSASITDAVAADQSTVVVVAVALLINPLLLLLMPLIRNYDESIDQSSMLLISSLLSVPAKRKEW